MRQVQTSQSFKVVLEAGSSPETEQRLTELYGYLLDCHENGKDEYAETDTKNIAIK